MNVLLRILFQAGMVAAILFALIVYCTRELVVARGDNVSPWDLLEHARCAVQESLDREPAAPLPLVRIPLEEVHLVGLTGTTTSFDLQALRGKVVLINFWGTWCPPCRAEFPAIEALARHYRRDRDVRVLAVSCSGGLQENLPQLKQQTAEFLAEQGTSMPTLADPDGRTRKALDRAFGFNAYPTTILLNGQGEIRGVWVGAPRDAERLFGDAIERVRTSDDLPLASGMPPARREAPVTKSKQPEGNTAPRPAAGPKTVANPFAG